MIAGISMATIGTMAWEARPLKPCSWLDLKVSFATMFRTLSTQKAVFVGRDWDPYPVPKSI
jgi:hypothetical protein